MVWWFGGITRYKDEKYPKKEQQKEKKTVQILWKVFAGGKEEEDNDGDDQDVADEFAIFGADVFLGTGSRPDDHLRAAGATVFTGLVAVAVGHRALFWK